MEIKFEVLEVIDRNSRQQFNAGNNTTAFLEDLENGSTGLVLDRRVPAVQEFLVGKRFE